MLPSWWNKPFWIRDCTVWADDFIVCRCQSEAEAKIIVEILKTQYDLQRKEE